MRTLEKMPPKLRCMRSSSSAMAWETVARRSQLSYGQSQILIVEFLLCVVHMYCLCAVLAIARLVLITVQPWGSELMTFSEDEGTKISRGAGKRGKLESSCHASRSPPATGIGTEEASRARKAYSPSNVPPQTPSANQALLLLSQLLPYSRLAMVRTLEKASDQALDRFENLAGQRHDISIISNGMNLYVRWEPLCRSIC